MKKITAILLVLAMLLMVVPSFAENTFKLGMIGPLTDSLAIYGGAAVNGAKIAAEEINALGEMKIEIEALDDKGDGELGVAAYNSLLDNGAIAIIGCVTSGSCISVASVAVDERIFMLTPSASSDLVLTGRDNVFQICFTDSSQGSASAQYISEHMAGQKIGIIYNNAIDYSVGIRDNFKTKAAELGLEIVAESTFSSDDNADFSVQISEMKAAGAEIVFLPIYYTPASMILSQSKAVEYSPIFFGVDGMDGILGMEGFDTSLAEGVMLLTPFAADAEDELTQNFVARYTEIYNDVPNQFAADGYDTIYAFCAAAKAAGLNGTESPEEACEKLIAVMPTISITGVTGEMRWEATGAVNKSPMAVVIENGVYVLAK